MPKDIEISNLVNEIKKITIYMIIICLLLIICLTICLIEQS